MAILGNESTPGSGTWFDEFTDKQFWSGPYSMPTGGGIVSDVYVYCAGLNAATTGQLVVWGASGNILWQSGNITLPAGSDTIGGQGWVHVGGLSVIVPAGNVYLGFWSSGNVVWTFEGSGGVTGKSGLSAPAAATGGSDEYGGRGYGGLGAYLVYSPGAIWYGDNSDNPHPIVAVWYGDSSGVPHKIAAIWVGQGNGVPKRIW